MPLCPQITNTPVTVVQNSDFDVTSVVPIIGNTNDGLANNFQSIEILADGKTKVYRSATEPTGTGINDGDLWIDTGNGNKLYVRVSGAWVSAQDASIAAAQASANAAAAAAGAAQSTATTALANAATAYNAAIGSLQPSANTIVNASNQITAINGTGITVYSGASATSGARVVLNSLGLAAYGAGSSVNITNVSGNGTTVTYTASGHSFTVGQSITVSGLAPNGYNGSFVITAVSAGLTFSVANTTTATVTNPNGLAERATLAISATTGNAVFSGSITGSSIIGGTLNIGGNAIIDSTGLLTATGATITGTINATAGYFGTVSNGWSISSTGLVGVGSGVISGGTVSGSTIVGSLIRSTNSVFQISATGSISGADTIGCNSLTATGTVSGSTVSSTGALSANSITITSTASFNGASNSFPNITQSTSAANLRWGTTTGGRIFESTASSAKFKTDIVDLSEIEELDPKKLLQLPVRAFRYKDDYLGQEDERSGVLVPGFIAEEVDSIYPIVADYENGEPNNWNDKFLIPAMMSLIQDLYKEIATLKGE